MSHSHAMRLILVVLLVGTWSGSNQASTIAAAFTLNVAQETLPGENAPLTSSTAGRNDTDLTQPAMGITPLKGGEIKFDGLPLYFVENQGQLDRTVAFYVLGGGTQIYFTQEGVTLVLHQPRRQVDLTPLQPGMTEPINSHSNVPNYSDSRWTVKLNFIGGKRVTPIGEEHSEATVSYFTGSFHQWETGVPTYRQVVYHQLWPGIDLVFYGQTGQLKYEFLVHPGADPHQIALQYRGAQQVHLDEIGNLEISTPLGAFTDQAPTAWQMNRSGKQPVEVNFSLYMNYLDYQPGNILQGVRYGFNISAYDPTQDLVIDPAVVVQCGYIGGLYYDGVRDIALDVDRNIYITGDTLSDETSFPVTVGPDLTQNVFTDAFVAKVNPSGTALLYAGYIGGGHHDYGWGIAVDDDGNAYVAGDTMSAADTFPELVGPYLALRGPMDGFVAKVSPDGTALLYCGYIGGHAWDHAFAVAVDGDGNAYITGSAGSDQGSFPVVGGPDLTFNGVDDGYIAKINSEGTGFVYAGYIGGDNWDRGDGVAVDDSGNAYVVGQTKSNQSTFPVLLGPDLTHNGDYDAFVAKVSPTGVTLVYAGYIGGLAEEKAWDVALDRDDNVYVVGETASPEASFPVGVGPDLSYNGGEKDAFVAKVMSSGVGLAYCGYIGGNGGDWAQDVAVDSEGNAYLIGYTNSWQPSFPLINGPDASYNGGGSDAFISKVDDLGTQLLYSGYIGGTGSDYGTGITVDRDGNAYVGGITSSDQDTFPVWGWFDLSWNGDYDGFVAKVSLRFRYFVPIAVR